MNRNLSITVRGRSGAQYSFTFKADPAYLDEWRADGLEIYELLNTVPVWAQRMGLTHVWCRVQDAWQWARLW